MINEVDIERQLKDLQDQIDALGNLATTMSDEACKLSDLANEEPDSLKQIELYDRRESLYDKRSRIYESRSKLYDAQTELYKLRKNIRASKQYEDMNIAGLNNLVIRQEAQSLPMQSFYAVSPDGVSLCNIKRWMFQLQRSLTSVLIHV